jgi:hypothetical protein
LTDDRRLTQMFTEGLEKLGWSKAAGPATASALLPEWLLRLYRGRLQPTGLSELGLAIS